MVDAAVAARFRGAKRAPLDEVARRAREFREWLRTVVTGSLGKPVRATGLAPLNELLAADTSYPRIVAVGGTPSLVRERRWESAEELLLPLAEAAADLICNADFRLVRACEGRGCTLLFLDRTKSHARRWCSMAVCGNRAKAAAHRARMRE
jgi:predicted RNA-binding Zn ribbon-like protein